MGYSLSVCGDMVMLFTCKLNPFRAETGENLPDKTNVFFGSSMIDLDKWLAPWIDFGSM